MTQSIEKKCRQIEDWIKNHPLDGHPHYWCAGPEADYDECNLDHPMTDLHISMLAEERALLSDEPS